MAPIPVLLGVAAFTQFVFNRFVASASLRAALSPALVVASCLGYAICGRITGADAQLERHAVVYHCLEHPSPMCREVARGHLDGFDDEELLRIEARANPSRRFAEDLSPASRAALEKRYAEMVQEFTARDFERVDRSAREIMATVYDFKDVRAYAAIARRDLQAERESRHREALQENRDFHLRQIDALVETAGPLVARAARDRAVAGELRQLAGDILRVNPSDGRALRWLHDLNRSPASR